MEPPRLAGLFTLMVVFAAACDVTPPNPPPPTAGDVSACGLHASVETPTNFVVFDKGSEEVAVLIARTWEVQGAGTPAVYLLAAFAITHEGATRCLKDNIQFGDRRIEGPSGDRDRALG